MSRAALLFGLVSSTLSVGCADTPAEPGSSRSASTEGTAALAPLEWTTPDAFVELARSNIGTQRATYRVPKTGSDNEDGELVVLFYGTGSAGDRDAVWAEWFAQFDGDAKASASRESFETNGATIELFEHVGDYKLNLGPRRAGMKRSPVQMVKKQHRMLGAVVRTKGRGNWFVRIVGPNETVLAAKPAFRQLLESVR